MNSERKEGPVLSEIRNLDGKLVCLLDEATGAVEIKMKGCITRIKLNPDGTANIIHLKDTAA